MTAGIYNATIDQGSDWSVTITYTDSAGDAINLTSYTAAMQLRQNYNSEEADLTLSTTAGSIVITGATGTVVVSITAAQTGSLSSDFYVYDLELTSPEDVVTRLIQGQLTVAAEVTRVE
tara:strand:- start:1030 stop:1386 length:357 start_codon:yes stop_codon:yes gene_type:complete